MSPEPTDFLQPERPLLPAEHATVPGVHDGDATVLRDDIGERAGKRLAKPVDGAMAGALAIDHRGGGLGGLEVYRTVNLPHRFGDGDLPAKAKEFEAPVHH